MVTFTRPFIVQKGKFSIKNFFSKCDQIRRKPRIWSHLLKKSLVTNFIFCAAMSMSHHVNEEHILKVALLGTLIHDKAVDTWEIVLNLYVEFSNLCNVLENVLLFSNLKKFPWYEKNKVFYISNFKTRLLLLEQKSILYIGVMGLFNILI